MEHITFVNAKSLVGMIAAATAVFVGVNIREIGIRAYVLVLITAVLATAAVIETWFSNSTVMKSATVGWIIGYITDDVLLTINSLLPNFIKDLLDSVTSGIKNKIDKWLWLDKNSPKE